MTDLADRVARLERRMNDVHDLARRTDQEAASWRGVLNNHTYVLNGMSDRLDRFRRSVDERFDKVDERFDKVDERFDKVDTRFGNIEGRLDKIADLLTTVINKSGKS